MSFGVTVNKAAFKQAFFENPKVTRKVQSANVRARARSGALVRKIAQRSIRKRKKKSKPGEAPSSHSESGHRLRQNIFFAEDRKSGGVVIGPAGLKQNSNSSAASFLTRTRATETVEEGGRVGIREAYLPSVRRWVRQSAKTRRARLRTRVRWVNVKARPYMGPALTKAGPQLAKFWKNSVKG